MRIHNAMTKLCLVVEDPTGHMTWHTWSSLVAEVAYKLGLIHSDDEIPVALDEIATYRIGDLSAIDLMMRNFGVLASQASQDLLTQLDPKHQGKPHPPTRKGMLIAGVLDLSPRRSVSRQ